MGATGMGVALGGKLLAGVLSDKSQAEADAKTLGLYANQAVRNARIKLIQAEDARYRGREQMVEHGRSVSRLLGKQRVGAAGQGITFDGSVQEIADETVELSAEDLAKIRVNAGRAAMGFELESNELMQEAAEYKRQEKKRTKGTILTSLANRAPGALMDAYSYGLFKGGK